MRKFTYSIQQKLVTSRLANAVVAPFRARFVFKKEFENHRKIDIAQTIQTRLAKLSLAIKSI